MGVLLECRRAGLLALACAGALSGHGVGYATGALLGGGAELVAHEHLQLLTWLWGVAGAVAILALAAAGARRASCCAGVRLRPLLSAQLAVYGWLEISERVLLGESLLGLLTAPVLLGLAAQPVTAWTLVLLLAAATRVARRLLRRLAPFVVPAPLRRRSTGLRRPQRRLLVPSSGSRAPPITC